MKSYLFKTSINCGGCLSRVRPILDKEPRIKEWSVDLDHPDRILSVTTEDCTPSDIIDIIDNAGFEIEQIIS
ncbi:MAG TPA: heavy-metal-associated domain-containing protein [Bacteroidales bacterium]|nr:heavy-metal-associated domain-containing protein [Bacteroidales bacterium]